MRKQNGTFLLAHLLVVWFLGEILINLNSYVQVSFSNDILGWNLSSCLTLDSTHRNNFRKDVKGKSFLLLYIRKNVQLTIQTFEINFR